MCAIIGQQSQVLEIVFRREITLMGNYKKMLNFVLVFSFFIVVPFRHVAPSGRTQEASNDKNISNYIYFPFISNPEPIRIVSHLTCDRGGDLIIDGWIENHTKSTIYSVKLLATMYDQNSESYGPYEIRPAFEATFPDNSNPFVLRTIHGFYCEWDKWNHDIEVDSWSFYSPYEYRPVTVVNVEWENAYHWSYFYGTIRNDHEATLHGVKVILISPQISGSVTAIYDTVLSPGEEVMFSATIMHPYFGDFNDEAVYVLGQGYLIP